MKQLLILAGVFIIINVYGQTTDQEFTVMFYNVENLFDTENEPGKADNNYTPDSDLKWNQKKFEKKLSDLSNVISSVCSPGLPDIVGLCEVENHTVLDGLLMTEQLKEKNYSVIHFDSPDVRGIDVALIFRQDHFTVSEKRAIPVIIPVDSNVNTRDILYVKGLTREEETLHLFVNHWKSRSEGVRETEPRRIYAAITIRKEIDLIMNNDPEAKIIIMGDFNDEPTNRSINEMLLANNKRKNVSPRELFNLMYDMHNMGNTGTYFYRGTWNMLDQIIISRPLLNDRKGIHTDYDGGRIFRQEWMLREDKKSNEQIPNRTYGGTEYFGGVSDHLPVYVTFDHGL